MPKYYAIITDIVPGVSDEATVFVGLDPSKDRTATYRVLKDGYPMPPATPISVNAEGFGKTDALAPTNEPVLVQVDSVEAAAVSFLQKSDNGRLYLVIPESTRTLGKKFRAVRKGGANFSLYLANPGLTTVTVTYKQGAGAPQIVNVHSYQVKKIDLPTPAANVEIDVQGPPILVQASIGNATRSGLIPPLA